MGRIKNERRPRQTSFVQKAVSHMRDALVENKREMTTRKTAEEIRKAPKDALSDEVELMASMERLEAVGLMFAFHESRRVSRILQSEAEKHLAIADGFTLWSPRDMFEYVHLPEKNRSQLRAFKRIFSAGGFEWEKPQ